MSKALFLALQPHFQENLKFHRSGNKEKESILHLGFTVGDVSSKKHSRPVSELGSEAGTAHFLLRCANLRQGQAGRGLGLKSPQLLGWGLGVARDEPQIREESEQGYMRSRPLRMHAPILVGGMSPQVNLGVEFSQLRWERWV